MASRTPSQRLREARALVARYLDPRRSWDPARDARLRALNREDGACAAIYDAAVVRHRLLVGGHPDLPSGFERRRLATAFLAPSPAPPPRSAWRGRWVPAAGLLAAAAVAVLLLVPRGAPGPLGDERLHARGVAGIEQPERLVGVGISGVDASESEYEIIASGVAHLGDWIRVTYTNERPELGWLFLVGVQPERPAGERVVWLAPLPEEGGSVAVGVARLQALPFEIRLGARHAPGAWHVLALFTERPLTTDEVARALDSSTLARLPSEWGEALRERLSLSPRAVIQRLETRIERGDPPEEFRP